MTGRAKGKVRRAFGLRFLLAVPLLAGCSSATATPEAIDPAAAAPPVPPPAMQKTADCQAPVYATDQLVCGDDDLRAIDIQLVAALQSADQRATDGLEPFLEPQGDWLRRRSMCAFESDHRGCVVDAYRERLTVLLGMERLEKASMSPGFACEKTDGAANLLAQWVSPAALAIIEDREVVGIALRAVEGGSSWQPYLSISGERQLAITRGGSTILSCAAA